MQPIYIADARTSPLRVGIYHSTSAWLQSFFTMTGDPRGKVPLFNDARTHAMVQQARENPDIQLIGSVSLLGEYWIVAFAAFHLRRPCKDHYGEELRQMLHGHARYVMSSF